MSTTEEPPIDPPVTETPAPPESPSKEEEIKPETATEPASKDDTDDGHTPWDFLTVNPDTDATVKRESPERPLALLVNKTDEKVTVENDTEEDKAMDKDARTFIEALDHLTEHKQDSYFYEQNRYGEPILFPEHALLDVASEETVTPEGTKSIWGNSAVTYNLSVFVFWKVVNFGSSCVNFDFISSQLFCNQPSPSNPLPPLRSRS